MVWTLQSAQKVTGTTIKPQKTAPTSGSVWNIETAKQQVSQPIIKKEVKKVATVTKKEPITPFQELTKKTQETVKNIGDNIKLTFTKPKIVSPLPDEEVKPVTPSATIQKPISIKPGQKMLTKEALEQIKLTTITKKTSETFISQAPKQTVWDKITTKISELFTNPEDEKARAMNAMAVKKTPIGKNLSLTKLAEKGGNPLKNSLMEDVTKQLGIRTTPTTSELGQDIFSTAIALGLISAPIPTLVAIGVFSIVNEIKSGLISTVKGKGFKLGTNQTLSDLFNEAPPDVKNVLDIIDFLVVAKTTHKIYKTSPSIFEKLTKDTIEKYNMPATINITPAEIRKINLGKGGAYETDLVKSLGWTTEQWKSAVKSGASIEIPSEKLVRIVDKPYWKKIKSILGKTPTNIENVIKTGSKVKSGFAGYLTDGEKTPQEIINTVMQSGQEKTTEGKELIKSAIEAKKTGQNIIVEKPKTVINETIYHGTPSNIELKDLSVDFTGKNVEGKVLAKGIYFSNKPEIAKDYANYAKDIKKEEKTTPKIIEAQLKNANLKIIESNDFITEKEASPIRDAGYDGILRKGVGGSKGYNEYIIFNKDILSKPQVEGGVEKPIISSEDIKKYTSAKDLADATHNARSTDQVGYMDSKTIKARDLTDRKQVEKVKADIKAGKTIEPIEITKTKDGFETVDGSHRLVAFQEMNKPVPVIYRGESKINGLKTFEEIYKEYKPIEKQPIKETEKVSEEFINNFIIKKHGEFVTEGQKKGIKSEKLNIYGITQLNKLVGSKLRSYADTDKIKEYLINNNLVEIKEDQKPIKQNVPEEVNTYLKNTYETTFEKATVKQINEALTNTKKPIIDTDYSLLNKVGNSNRGVVDEFETRPGLLYGSVKKKIFTDGFIMIYDKEVADIVRNKIIKKEEDKEVKRLIKIGLTAPEARKTVENQTKNRINDPQMEQNFPSDTAIKGLTSDLENRGSEMKLQGYQSIGVNNVILTNGTDQSVISADKLALFKKYYPDLKLFQKFGDTLKPVSVWVKNELKGLIMPIRAEKENIKIGINNQPQTKKKVSTPSGYADAGGYSDVKSAEKTVENIKSVEFPELLRITKELMGTPYIRKFRGGYLGMFRGYKGIQLSPEIFKDPVLASKVLAHELGHLTDFIPEGTLSRGNLLGRIASLRKYYKSFLEETPGAEMGLLTEKDRIRLRKEAKELAKKPVQEEYEIIVGESKATPEEILAIWNDTQAGEKFPELQKYIQTLSVEQKVEILKSAIKKIIPEWFGFKTLIKKKGIREVIKDSPADVKKLYKQLLEEEVRKRRLFNLETIREELKTATQLWKPFVEDLVPPGYKEYRYSGKELYADAISILFNDPKLLEQTAPNFYKAFFNYLDNKPEAKKAFEEIWTLLNEGEDAVFKKRDEELSKSFEKGQEAFTAKYLEKQKKGTSLWYQVKLLFDDKNTPIKTKINELRKQKKDIPANLNPDYALKGLLYSEGELKNYINDNFQPIFAKTQQISDGWNKLGKIVFYDRVINERGEFANPQGYDPKTAQDQLNGMEKQDPEGFKKIQEAKKLFQKAVQESVDLAEKNGYYTPELLEKMKTNPSYATFQVIDYLDTYVTPRVYQQKGTLKDIANPATSTVMKLINLKKAIKRNDAKKLNIDFLTKYYSKEIETADTRWNGKSMDIKPPKDPDKELVIIIENGKPQGYYVEKDIGEMLNYSSNTTLEMLSKLSRVVSQSRFYRPLFTMYNLGFQTFNLVRDIRRAWKNYPHKSLAEVPLAPIFDTYKIGRGYLKALVPSAKRTLNRPDQIIKEMENANILGLTYNDIYSGEVDPEAKQIERIFEQAGIIPKSRKYRILSPFTWVLDKIGMMGDFIETLPKVAGYTELKGKMPEKELAEFIRTSIGSPAFRVGGKATPITNSIFLFSNAIKEGIKSDINVATGKKGRATGAGFWWKTVISDLLPTVIMAGISWGLFGDDLKKQMDKVSEYDKTNYTIIPLGYDEKNRCVYMRIPHDETGRFIKGLFWKSLNINKDKDMVKSIMDILSFNAGQLPNLTPSFTGAGAVMQYLSGKNPYDSYRGRNVVPDTEFKAGVKYSLPVFLDWLVKNQGLGIIYPTYKPDQPTDLEKILNAPGLSNILGRWVKVSDYGETEKLREITAKEEEKLAQKQLSERKIIDEAIKNYLKNPTSANRKQIEIDMIKKVLGKPPYDSNDRRKRTNTLKKFRISAKRKGGDVYLNSLIDANTNKQKVELLSVIKDKVTKAEFDKLVLTARREKIISINVVREFNRLKK